MRMTEEEFRALCANKHLNATIQAGRNVGERIENPEQPKKKPTKYRNRKVYVYSTGVALYEKDSRYGDVVMVFDSEKEFRRHQELKILERQGKISALRRQVPFLIQDACERDGEKIAAIFYKADFCYEEDGKSIVEDVKGFDEKTQKYITTKDFNLKWKLLKYRYPDQHFSII